MIKLKDRNVPVNTRNSGDDGMRMLIDTRIRKSPFWHKSLEAGCWCCTVYNHMYHPRAYASPQEGGLMKEYEHLTKHVSMWNVAVERQICVKGPDAIKLVDYVITRDAYKKLPVGKARYVILCNEQGGIINDPVLLRVDEDEFWFSISDTDVLFWLQGINVGGRFDVEIKEIDVSPLQIQGPKSKDMMVDVVGEKVLEVPYYGLMEAEINGVSVVISRTGFSGEVGYEVYVREATEHAEAIWDHLLEAGKPYSIMVIAPSHIRRLEAGILSYGQDMDIETNPFEVGLDWQVDLDKGDYVGKQALARLKNEPREQLLVGMRVGGERITWYNEDYWPIIDGSGKEVGFVTSAFYAPQKESNIAMGFVPPELAAMGTRLTVRLPEKYGGDADAEVVQKPFLDPEKKIPSTRFTQVAAVF
ncbi:MAG: aminomethyl transferase family protein [Pseudomonadota bacterium]|nr:MAG: aminomethyl transferase family protein [Pseudomonadota bacterium]